MVLLGGVYLRTGVEHGALCRDFAGNNRIDRHFETAHDRSRDLEQWIGHVQLRHVACGQRIGLIMTVAWKYGYRPQRSARASRSKSRCASVRLTHCAAVTSMLFDASSAKVASSVLP